MMPMVNLNNNIEKELELEHQGMRRTRRYIGDANSVADVRWYQARAYRIPEYKSNLPENGKVIQTQTRRDVFNSILNRFSTMVNTRRQPVSSKS
jgi:hypothetical protein